MPGMESPEPVLSQRGLLSIAALFLLVTLLQVQCAPARPVIPPPGAFIQPVESEALADTGKGDPSQPVEKLIPEEPEPWQKRPPCDAEQDERLINGACWQATSRRPPCGSLWRHEDLCVRPIAKAKGRPVSDPP